MSDGGGDAAAAGSTDRWHALSVDEVTRALGVDPDIGLSADEVARRQAEHGPNHLGEGKGTPWWRVVWNQVADAIIVLLLGAAAAGLLAGEVVEAAAIGVVLVANTLVGFVTELRAARSMESLRALLSTTAEVERDDRRDEVDATELVPGDIVGMEVGEQVPADLRVLDAEDLRVEEAGLTGESEPVTKGTDPVDAAAPLAERTSMLHTGTTVVAGRGRGVGVATGRATEMGRISGLTESAQETEAPLQEGLSRLSRQLAVAVVVGAVALLGLGVARGLAVDEAVEIAVALAIAVVPEGLPAVATLTLAVGMRRMAAGNALVRRLPAVETLGSTTVVCSDKTGTLTHNEMQVVEVLTADGVDDADLWATAVACNDADIDPDGDPVGDPTEVGLLRAATDRGVGWRERREEHPRAREVPFTSQAKRMAVVDDSGTHVKGAPEVLLDPDEDRGLWEAAETMAAGALRVLAFARGPSPDDGADDDELFARCEVLGIIAIAVAEGRRIFTNIRRFAQFLFSWHLAEVAVITIALAAGVDPPLAGLMILWNNLIIDVLPSFALALEPGRDDVMDEPPRDPSEPVVDRGLLRRTLVQAALVAGAGLAAFGLGRWSFDLPVDETQTMAFVAMTIGQTLGVFNARTERGSGFAGATRNPWLWAALATTASLTLLALTFGPLTDVLGLARLGASGYVVAAALGLVPVAAIQGARALTSRAPPPRSRAAAEGTPSGRR